MTSVNRNQRFTKQHPCPVCLGYSGQSKGKGRRCWGFISTDKEWAHCTREEFSDSIMISQTSNTYAHKLSGNCNCGKQHGPTASIISVQEQPGIVSEYTYTDERGVLVYQAIRYQPKQFKFRRPDGQGGWRWDLQGVQRYPYKLTEMLASEPDKPVFVVEGEKDVEKLIALGLLATTNPMGAGRWLDEYNKWFAGRCIVIIPDNDEPGLKHAEDVARNLYLTAKSVRVIELPGVPEKGDFSDWIDLDHDVEELLTVVANTPSFQTISSRTSDFPSLGAVGGKSLDIQLSTEIPLPADDQLDGLLGPFIPPKPALVLISGESSAGKSILSYNMAYSLSSGFRFAGALEVSDQLKVLYVDLENPDGVHRSWVQNIGRSDNLAFIRELPLSLSTSEGRMVLSDACRGFNADILIIDPLSMAWPVDDENANGIADFQMQSIKKMAVDLDCVILVLWNMGEGHLKDKFRARGATARIDRADIAMNYSELNETSRQLKIVKSRYGSLHETLGLRFAGELGFDVIQISDTYLTSAINEMCMTIKNELQTGLKERGQLISALQNESLVDKALAKLLNSGDIIRPSRGKYNLVVSSSSPSLNESGKEESNNLSNEVARN